MTDLGATPHSSSARRSQALVRAILAIVLGIGIWVTRTISVNPVVERTVEMPVTVVGAVPEGMSTKPEPDKVSITVLGPSDSIDPERLQAELTAQVDPASMDASGRVVVTIAGDVRGVDVLSIAPEVISLRTLDSKLVAVRVRVTGPDASTVPAPKPSPAEVKVTGPKDIVDRVSVVEAQVWAPALLRQGWDDSHYILLLTQDSKSLEATDVTLEPSRVRVNATVPSVETPVRAVTSGTLAEGLELGRITVTPPSVQVSGPPELLQSLAAVETAPIDLTGRTGPFEISTSLRPPEGITPYRESTVKVSVEIRKP